MHPAAFSPRARLTFALMTFLLLGLPVPTWPGDTPEDRATLKGITAIRVVVEYLDPEAERDGLTRDRLQTAVEGPLRVVGIKVTSSREEAGNSYLYLNVSALKDSSGLYSLSLSLEFWQGVRLDRNPSIFCDAVTWSVGSVATVGAEHLRDEVPSSVARLVDRFINAYLEQNPRA